MLKRTLAIIPTVLLLTAVLAAQETKPVPAQTAKPEPAPESAREDTLPQTNIKLDFIITDHSGGGEPGRRSVSMIVAEGRQGMIRTGGSVLTARSRYNVTLNIDARPVLLDDSNKVLVELAVEYLPKPVGDSGETGEGRASLNQQLATVLPVGKPTVISQAADPTSDRRVTVEVTATILK